MDYGEGLTRELKFNTPLNIGVCDKIYKRNNKRALSRPRGRLTARSHEIDVSFLDYFHEKILDRQSHLVSIILT
jgi:hypothetical protein